MPETQRKSRHLSSRKLKEHSNPEKRELSIAEKSSKKGLNNILWIVDKCITSGNSHNSVSLSFLVYTSMLYYLLYPVVLRTHVNVYIVPSTVLSTKNCSIFIAT